MPRFGVCGSAVYRRVTPACRAGCVPYVFVIVFCASLVATQCWLRLACAFPAVRMLFRPGWCCLLCKLLLQAGRPPWRPSLGEWPDASHGPNCLALVASSNRLCFHAAFLSVYLCECTVRGACCGGVPLPEGVSQLIVGGLSCSLDVALHVVLSLRNCSSRTGWKVHCSATAAVCSTCALATFAPGDSRLPD